jgi:hypothetical protein
MQRKGMIWLLSHVQSAISLYLIKPCFARDVATASPPTGTQPLPICDIGGKIVP